MFEGDEHWFHETVVASVLGFFEHLGDMVPAERNPFYDKAIKMSFDRVLLFYVEALLTKTKEIKKPVARHV